MTRNLAASVRDRLKQHADAANEDFNLTLTRYGLERGDSRSRLPPLLKVADEHARRSTLQCPAAGGAMNAAESFRDRSFLVVDPDARIRRPEDLMAFALDAGGRFQTIPKGTQVRIDAVKVVETGSRSNIVFGHATSVNGNRLFGWTSTRNLEGKFMNETIGAVSPAPGASRFGPNAAWARGSFLGQIELAAIVDAKLEIERLALSTIEPYAALVAAAARDGVLVTLNSGFRSYPEQKHLHDGFERGLPGFNTAARPGLSNHQNGIAFDIAVPGGDGNPTYEWLKKHATRFGFVRTVSKEPWHWEFDVDRARVALQAGTFMTPNVTA
ncbi:M15 family metallopeptidase [Aquabacterium humicola]|uniref:M15 family metallopeptidase n=1 Tax=Aquabacterium humicola TaxID=3237377 RepID=UPI0025427607|nr:M15 family metallopeptidase [Rubrivivax pictus]